MASNTLNKLYNFEVETLIWYYVVKHSNNPCFIQLKIVPFIILISFIIDI